MTAPLLDQAGIEALIPHRAPFLLLDRIVSEDRATQTLIAKKAKNLLIQVDGQLPKGCSAKDIVLAIIGTIGTAGGTGYTIELLARPSATCPWKAA